MLICLFFFFLCLLFPEISGEGVRRGLSLSFTQVIPSLYPFILLTTLFKALSHDSRYARRLSLFADFLSGYPLGAKVVAEQYDGGLFTPRAMLVICNNPSPAYMLSFVGLESLGRPVYGLQMYAAILTGNLLTGILISCFSSRKQSRPAPTVLRAQSAPSKMSLTDRVFQDTFETIVRICGYILAAAAAAAFIRRIPIFPPLIRAVLTGCLEMTAAVEFLAPMDLPPALKLPLITGIISFGGLSVFAQTRSMIVHSHLSIKKYMTDKAIASAIASSIMYMLLHYII